MNLYRFDMADQQIRVTVDHPRRASIFDLIKNITDNPNPHQAWTNLQQRYPELLQTIEKVTYKFPGKGQRLTPVCDARGLVQIVGLLPGERAAKFREAEADVLVRFLGGDETLVEEIRNNHAVQEMIPHDSCLHIFGEQAASKTILSVTGMQDWVSSQVYIGQPVGTFANMRAVGNDLPIGIDLNQAFILKTGYQLSEGRVRDHVKAFGGFSLVDSFPTNCCQFAERAWKDKLANMGRLLRGKHSNKAKEDTELFWVANQDDYANNIAPLLAQVIQDCAATFSKTLAIEKEKTRQHEVTQREISRQHEATERTRQLEIQAETKRLEAIECTKREAQREVERTKQLELQVKLAQLGSGMRIDSNKKTDKDVQKMVTFQIPSPYGQHVTQHSLDGTHIRSWESASEAATELGCNYGHIRACVNGQLNKHAGFVWKGQDIMVDREVPYNEQGAYVQSLSDGTFVNSYNSLQIASKIMSVEYYTLRNVVNTGKALKGFVWTRVKQNRHSTKQPSSAQVASH